MEANAAVSAGIRQLAERVRADRLSAGLTQAQAAARGGCATETWKAAEKGKKVPREFTMAAIERALGWAPGTASALVRGEEAPAVAQPSVNTEVADSLRAIRADLAEIKRRLSAVLALLTDEGATGGA